jgi:hypothetical protein
MNQAKVICLFKETLLEALHPNMHIYLVFTPDSCLKYEDPRISQATQEFCAWRQE